MKPVEFEVKQPTKAYMHELMDICRNLDGVVPSTALMGYGTWTKLMQNLQVKGGLQFLVIDTDHGATKFFPDAYCREGVVVFVWFDAETNHPHLQEFGNIGYAST